MNLIQQIKKKVGFWMVDKGYSLSESQPKVVLVEKGKSLKNEYIKNAVVIAEDESTLDGNIFVSCTLLYVNESGNVLSMFDHEIFKDGFELVKT